MSVSLTGPMLIELGHNCMSPFSTHLHPHDRESVQGEQAGIVKGKIILCVHGVRIYSDSSSMPMEDASSFDAFRSGIMQRSHIERQGIEVSVDRSFKVVARPRTLEMHQTHPV